MMKCDQIVQIAEQRVVKRHQCRATEMNLVLKYEKVHKLLVPTSCFLTKS
jgi:hypothetical protein